MNVRPDVDPTDDLPVTDNAEEAVDDGPGSYPDPDGDQDIGTEPETDDDVDGEDAGEDDNPDDADDAPDPEQAGG